MPRLHPVHYRGIDTEVQLNIAFAEADPSAAWALMKAGLATPAPENLDQVIRAGYRTGSYRHTGTTISELDESVLSQGETFVYGQPATEKAHARAQVCLANMLFAKNISPLHRYEVAGNPGTGGSTQYTTAAQEAFGLELHTKPNLAVLATVVLQALKEKPSWQPDIGHIFKNILEDTNEQDLARRYTQATHINQLGLLVGSRLKAMEPAKTGMQPEQLSLWTDTARWSIDPATQPAPTEAMRAGYKKENEATHQRMMAKLRKSGAFDTPAAD